MRRIRVLLLAAVVASLPVAPAWATPADCTPSADFDDDGFSDLAVGVPGESVGSTAGAGAVHVIYGGLDGLTATDDAVFTQATSGIANAPERRDALGSSVASGDFDGDGRSDLAVGVPAEDFSGVLNAGAVHVLYGSAAGLTAAGSQLWTQDSAGVRGQARAGERFGSALAACDFDGDGADDLAIGAPGAGSGEVSVLYGSAAGLTAAGDDRFDQSTTPGAPEAGDRFGGALAAGDFDGDGRGDLAIGLPGEDVAGSFDAGAAVVLRGSASGLGTSGSRLVVQPGVGGAAEDEDGFGAALAAGDFDGDGRDDLAIGAAGEDVGLEADVGVVHVLEGTAAGLATAGAATWFQDEAVGGSEEADRFGAALATGDFDADDRDDLAIGVPGEVLGDAFADGGALNVLYGSASGLTATGAQLWSQESNGIDSNTLTDERFGSALVVGDFSGGLANEDLAVGVPGEDVSSFPDAGAINVLYGSAPGLAATNTQFWHQDATAILGTAEEDDLFGSVL